MATRIDPTQPQPPRVLVVDDEPHIAHVIALSMSRAGYRTAMANDGNAGIQMARAARPDLIITDHQMPYVTGLDMCRQMMRDPELAGIPAIMVTARGYALSPLEMDEALIVELVTKPFSPRMLVKLAGEVLEATTPRLRKAS
ncbi:MAG: response regulator [Planctomycetota bacterium]